MNFVKARLSEIRCNLVPDFPCGKTARLERLAVSGSVIGQSSSIIVKFRNALEFPKINRTHKLFILLFFKTRCRIKWARVTAVTLKDYDLAEGVGG